MGGIVWKQIHTNVNLSIKKNCCKHAVTCVVTYSNHQLAVIIWKIKKGKPVQKLIFPFLWCEPGLNRRHMDFQSIALPTELSHLISKKEFKEISPKGLQK